MFPSSDLPEVQHAYAIRARENGRTQIPLRQICDVTGVLKLPDAHTAPPGELRHPG